MKATGELSFIHDFLTSSSPNGLRRKEFANNRKHGVQFEYSTPVFVSGKWYAWYYRKIDIKAALSKDGKVGEVLDG